MSEPHPIPRLAADQPFPAYAYVPGRSPHPLSDPLGHSFGSKRERPEPPEPDRWHLCRPYLYGIDLFNHGYYWEAHEVWESLWHACGRAGPTGHFLKGLIKLAAAGVKVRQGILQGVKSHAQRAAQLFRQTAAQAGGDRSCYLGLCLKDLIQVAEDIAVSKIACQGDPSVVPTVFPFVLIPAYPDETGS